MQALDADAELRTLLNAADGTLIDSQIYPYDYIPTGSEAAKAFITLHLAAPAVESSATRTTRLTLRAFVDASLMWMQGEGSGARRLRCDRLAERIDRLLGGSMAFGSRLRLVSYSDGYRPREGYWGVELTYETRDLNRPVTGA